MRTVENDRIRVTVTEKIWSSFRERAENHAWLMGHQDIECVQRGLVLSEAMSRLGNASEAQRLKTDAIDPHEVLKLAEEILVEEHLREHCRYNVNEILMRIRGGHRISEGAKRDVDNARAWAGACLNSDAEKDFVSSIARRMIDKPLTDEELRGERKRLEVMRSASIDRGRRALIESEKSLESARLIDIEYRHARGEQNGWRIEILSELPTEIGACRYELAPPSPTMDQDETKALIRKVLGPFWGGEKPYPSPLPPEIASWHCYTSDGGHCILVVLQSYYADDADLTSLLCPAPVKTVLRVGYQIRRGFVICDLPYSPDFGLETDSDDDEF